MEEFRKQLQQDQPYAEKDDVVDVCLGDFIPVEKRIIRARESIEQGATFLSAPGRVYSWEDCVHSCCSDPHCTVAVVQEDLRRQSDDSLSCYLFNCTYRNKNVCSFAAQQDFSTYSRAHNTTTHLFSISGHGDGSKMVTAGRRPEEEPITDHGAQAQDVDEPPRSDAGKDVVIQLPTDWAVLDGRDSLDDHGVTRYEWALVRGDTAINMKVTHPGLLKVSDLQEGVYTFQMTVTDTAGQKSSDNVSVTVLAPGRQAEICTGRCSRYQFNCDDGCCIDITYACDGKQQCPDRSDEAFCENFDGTRKTVSHPAALPSPRRPAVGQTEGPEDPPVVLPEPRKTVEEPPRPPQPQPLDRMAPPPPVVPQSRSQQDSSTSQDSCASPLVVGPCQGTFPRWFYDALAGECKHFVYGGCRGNHNNFLQKSDCVSECIQRSPPVKEIAPPPASKHTETVPISESKQENEVLVSKPYTVTEGHPVPESGAILPLALGLIITAMLLLLIGCRLRLVRHTLKKTRPLTTEESDYLINGMYL